MSEVIAWIAAVAESGENDPEESSSEDLLSAGQAPANTETAPAPEATESSPEQPDALEELFEYERQRRVYRGRTTAMLRKYMRYSLETGRLPSLVGREFFRSKVTKYRVTTFEDRVIFVHDMENCLQRLDHFSQQVLARIVLQEYEHEEAARLLGCTDRTIRRWLREALDKLSDILCAAGLLDIVSPPVEKSCQEGPEEDFRASDGAQRK
jgi:predicted DNA-binding protein (UPF0251 family)